MQGSNLLNYIIALLCSLAVFTGTNSYISQHILESKHQLLFQGFFPVDCNLTVFSQDSNGKRSDIETITIEGKSPNVDQRFLVALDGVPIEKLGINIVAQQPVSSDASIHLHFIKFINSFTEDVYISHVGVRESFESNQFAYDEINRLDFADADGQISLISKNIENPDNILFTSVMPIVFALITFLFLLKLRIKDLPAYNDMGIGGDRTQSAQVDAINGVRGLSAILVLLSHTAPGFASIKMGLALLFVMSGFLLSKPFVLASNNIFSVKTIHKYIVKRSKRILPMYYFTIFVVYLVDFEFDIAIRHFLFLEAREHLWAIPQILTFYLLLPFILIVTSLFHKIHRVAPVLLLLTLILLWRHYALFPNLFYNGSYHTPFMLDSFLLGVTISYIQYGIIQSSERLQYMLSTRSFGLSLSALLFTFFSIAWSAPLQPPAWIAPYIDRFDVKCLLSAIIILFVVNTPQSLYSKIIGNPVFRSIGIVGFSFYLLQGLGIDMVLLFQKNVLAHEILIFRSWTLTLSVLALTYFISIFTYSYIERPFFGKKTT
jgi:peptidoglycan/LPS O-acetylase OafA/YrhL